MSIIADIKQAKAEYLSHLAGHKCSYKDRCHVRIDLIQEWMTQAELWGTEPDDKQRQEDHFYRTFPDAVRPAA